MENLDYLLFMQALVQQSNKIALKYFHEYVKAEYKDDASPVTIADKMIEELLRKHIKESFPEHDIIGEEFENLQRKSDYCWVIDPIDGTKNFAAGIPCFATLVALCYKDKPILGCISAPAMNKIWTGGRDNPARCNGIPIKTRNCIKISDAWLSYTSPSMFLPEQLKNIQKIEQQTKVNIYGNDAIAFALLAEGKIDLVIENQLKMWDFCAVMPVIEAAGGYVSDFSGKPLELTSDGSFIGAATKSLHAELRNMI
ncbi:MAG: inositol monophosphatase family protein [Alphaproteobacteria bacterium]